VERSKDILQEQRIWEENHPEPKQIGELIKIYLTERIYESRENCNKKI